MRKCLAAKCFDTKLNPGNGMGGRLTPENLFLALCSSKKSTKESYLRKYLLKKVHLCLAPFLLRSVGVTTSYKFVFLLLEV